MGKLQTAAQTTTPQQDQEAPTTASGELTGLQAELMRAQQLAGAGNAYVQDQLNQQAAASVEAVMATTAEAVEVTQSPEAEVADVEQAIEEVEVAVEGAEEGGVVEQAVLRQQHHGLLGRGHGQRDSPGSSP